MTSSISSSSHPLVISYERLEHEVQEEIKILRGKKDYFNCTDRKIYKIQDAIRRLGQVVRYQCELIKEDHPIARRRYFDDIDPDQATSQDLSTYDAMLDAAFRVWETETPSYWQGGERHRGQPAGYYRQLSLRQALNLSRNNFLNFSGGLVVWGPLWGKTDTLKAIEGRVKRLPVE